MSNLYSLKKTPTKSNKTNDSSLTYELPDTPTSLASSYNKYDDDLIGPLQKTHLEVSDNSNESKCSNKIKYNPLHDSIETFPSNQYNNDSIIADFQDIEAMIEQKRTENKPISRHKNDSDLIEKWLEDRKRWDSVQQSYEQKIVELETNVQNKSLHFNQRLDAHFKKELKYQNEIKNLNQRIEKAHSTHNAHFGKLDCDYQQISENNRELNTKINDLQQQCKTKENMVQTLQQKLKEKECIMHQLQIEHKTILNRFEKVTIHTQETNEYKKENERLKHLELTSQNMVERLLKRLEQQIHSSENVQKQMITQQKEYESEMMKLENINAKLQKQLTILNQNQTQKCMLGSCSESSLFTLSTAVTMGKNMSRNTSMKCMGSVKENLNTNNIKIKKIPKQSVLIEQLKNEICEKNKDLNKYRHSIDGLETILNRQKSTIHTLEENIKKHKDNILKLEKKNSDISLELIEERAMRQKFEKDIEDLQFKHKEFRKKLAKSAEQRQHTPQRQCLEQIQSTESESSTNNNDQLLLDSLKSLINKYSNVNNTVRARSAPHTTHETQKKNKKKHRLSTPKNMLVNSGDFIHNTVDRLQVRNNNKKLSKKVRRISSLAPVSYLYDANNNKTARNVSMKRKRNIASQRRAMHTEAITVCRNKNVSHRKKNKSKIIKVPNSTKARPRRLISKNKRKKTSVSASKRQILRPRVSKRWE